MSLNGAKPHVRDAALAIQAAIGIPLDMRALTISNAGGHPRGLAVDFQTGSNRALGDRIVAYVTANAAALGVDYVAWQNHLWSSDRPQWRAQGRGFGIDSQHRTHVHVEFHGTPGDGNIVPVANVGGAFSGLEDINRGARWIGDSHNWARIGMVVLGALLLLVAIVSWDTVKTTTTETIRKAAQ